jgi:D-alanyl-D-alanine endopeptidase (penicillin-binding protein 7)
MVLIMLRVSSFILLALLSTVAVAKPVTAKSFLVTDIDGEVILEKNADQPRSIASITKLMTAMVVLDAGQNLDEVVPINFKMRGRYHTHLPIEIRQLPRQTLLELALVKSDNLAAYTLCEAYPGGVGRCVAEMNHKAIMLHLVNTHYADPTGLDPENVSTARDLAQLVLVARHYKPITDASSMATVDLKVKRRWWHFGNTNPLVKKSNDVHVSKTGYIGASGGCVVMLLDTSVGQRVIVLLGSKNTRTRFPEAERIAVTISNSDVEVD